MATPDKMAPISPLLRIMTSAGANVKILCFNAANDALGAVKYSNNFTSSIMKIKTIGLKMAGSHDIRKIMFNRKPMPKNKTKNNNIEMSKTGILISIPITSSTSFLSVLNDRRGVNESHSLFFVSPFPAQQ